jgi:hypothetical protein
MRLTTPRRYVLFGLGIGSWIYTLNTLMNLHTLLAGAFGTTSFAMYAYRRWRTPTAIQRTSTGLRVDGHGQPSVIEFYADL